MHGLIRDHQRIGHITRMALLRGSYKWDALYQNCSTNNSHFLTLLGKVKFLP